MVAGIFGRVARWALDFALPPRCAGCGTIVADVHSFCPDCWKGVEFLGSIEDEGFGLVTKFKVPGAGAIGLYEPKHVSPLAEFSED